MSALLVRASARALWQHPWQLGLALLGIALGVGLVAAVQLTQMSAREALRYDRQALASAATDRIEALRGRLDEDVYVHLRQAHPDLQVAPLLKAAVEVGPARTGFLQLLGIDPLGTLGGQALAERAPGINPGRLMAPRSSRRIPHGGSVSRSTTRSRSRTAGA